MKRRLFSIVDHHDCGGRQMQPRVRAMMSSEKKSYRAEWICATVALCYSVFVIVSILYAWGQSFAVDKMGSLAISAALRFGVPLLCTIVAIKGSKGRPNGRIGFLPLMVTVGALVLWIADLVR